jgi:hypothetical protein
MLPTDLTKEVNVRKKALRSVMVTLDSLPTLTETTLTRLKLSNVSLLQDAALIQNIRHLGSIDKQEKLLLLFNSITCIGATRMYND